MSYLSRLVCATGLVLAAALSNLHAAPVCSSVVAKRQIPATAPSHAADQKIVRTQACSQDCKVAVLQRGDPVVALPAPTHLPVVSGTDEVAAWHAEIFEHLARSRAGAGPTQYCQLEDVASLRAASSAH